MSPKVRENPMEQAQRLETMSKEYALSIVNTVAFQLGDAMSDALPIIIEQLQRAWYEGWKAGKEES